VQPRSSVLPGTTAQAVIKTIYVGVSPVGVAVNDVDDTVYVANSGASTVSVIDGRAGVLADDSTIPVGQDPQGVAVDQTDDTVYVTNDDDSTVTVINGRTGTPSGSPINVGREPRAVAVNDIDDTVYVANFYGSTVSVINGRNRVASAPIPVGQSPDGIAVDQNDDTVYVASNSPQHDLWIIDGSSAMVDDTVTVGDGPYGVAVSQTDDTVFVANIGGGVSVVNGRTASLVGTVPVGNAPYGVAVSPDDTVYVTNKMSGSVSVIDGRTGQLTDDTITLGSNQDPWGIAVDDSGSNAGVVYVANNHPASNSVSVIARVAPSLVTSSGPTGGSVVVTVSVPQVSYAVDGSTVTSVDFGTGLISATPDGANQWRVTVPPGSGTVPVVVGLNGGLHALAGYFTYVDPAPSNPPGPPSDVVAVAGDGSAAVSWKAPADSGSFPVTDYQVTATPGGQSCLAKAPALTCMVSGLTNGTSYTFTVRGLNGAGWGTYSDPSNAVTPRGTPEASILISGSRDGGSIRVSGTTSGLVGEQVTPWTRFPGQASYSAGIGVQTVDAAGKFSWGRRTGKKTYVYFTHGSTRSNTVTIPAR